jgi:hypothetical protein
MVKITDELVLAKFNDLTFFEAYKHALKSLDELKFFPNTAWRRLMPGLSAYVRESIEKKVRRIMHDETIDDTVKGASIERDVGFPGLRVYEYIPTRVAQRIRLVKRSYFPPRTAKVVPYIGVDIWIDESFCDIDIASTAKDKYGHHIPLPRTINGFPVEYRLTEYCREP